MRDDILDAAEAIVRSHGRDQLTVSAVAEATHYGKSTIHSHIGSKEELLEALADRVMDRHIRALAALHDGPDDTGDGRFRTTAGLIIESPELAAVMFGRPRPSDIVRWSKRWVATFSTELHADISAADEAALAEALYLSHQQIVTVIPTIAAAGDVEFGARVLRETFQPFTMLARELEEHRLAHRDTV